MPQAANSGVIAAQMAMGVLYADGLGVEQSFDEAIKFVGTAYAQGHAEARIQRLILLGRKIKAEQTTRTLFLMLRLGQSRQTKR